MSESSQTADHVQQPRYSESIYTNLPSLQEEHSDNRNTAMCLIIRHLIGKEKKLELDNMGWVAIMVTQLHAFIIYSNSSNNKLMYSSEFF